ncbi:MAG: hypothetical protein RL434_208 [Pseudomonadota bacterium]|jgi:RNA-binding protein
MLSPAERRALRARAHPLKPVVLLGQHGVTPPVIAAIEEALAAHELIKVRLRGIEKEQRDAAITELAASLGAEVINLIGHILTLFRAAPPAPAPKKVPAKKKVASKKPMRKKFSERERPMTERDKTPWSRARRTPR